MPHTYFCCHEPCKSTNASMKCSNCLTYWYCSEACQKADWPAHKANCRDITHSQFRKLLFHSIATRLGYDVDQEVYQQFNHFMENESYLYPSRTIQEWMEDWLEGWKTTGRDTKELLRDVFHKNGLKWSADVYPLYQEWVEDRSTNNQYLDMNAFMKVAKSFF